MNGLRPQIWTALALALLTGACANYRPTTKFRFGTQSISAASTSNSSTTNTGNNNGSWGQGTNPPSTLRCDVGQEPFTYSIVGRGYTDVLRETFMTHHTFRIQVRAEVNSTIVEGTPNFTPQYSILGLFLKVFETEQQTPMLANGTHGTNQHWSQPIDFSSAFPTQCPNNDPFCRQPVEVQFTKPNSDYLYGLNSAWGLGWNHVQPNHTFEFTIRVETDDTNSLECQ